MKVEQLPETCAECGGMDDPSDGIRRISFRIEDESSSRYICVGCAAAKGIPEAVEILGKISSIKRSKRLYSTRLETISGKASRASLVNLLAREFIKASFEHPNLLVRTSKYLSEEHGIKDAKLVTEVHQALEKMLGKL